MENQTPKPSPTPPTENIPVQNPAVAETPPQVYTAPHIDNPPPKKPFLTGKIILIVIILSVILSAGGTYLALNSKPKPQPIVSKPTPTSAPTPTPDPTANWKTYADSNNSYSFKYPSDWEISSSAGTLYVTSPNKAKDDQGFHMDILGGITNQTFQEWLKDKNIGGYCCGGNVKLEDTTINSQKFYKVTAERGEYPGFITNYRGHIYYLTTSSGFGDGGVYYFDKNDVVLMKNLEVFNQILSTFKFTQ